MCFTDNNEYDWTADTFEVVRLKTGPASRCEECSRIIAPEHWRQNVFMQESDGMCLTCDAYPGEDADDCHCDEPTLGETSTFDTCRACMAMLAAIRKMEREENCPPHAQQPAPGGLREVFTDHESATEYAVRIATLFPSLKSHRFICGLLDDHSRRQMAAVCVDFVREWNATWVDPDDISHEWHEVFVAAKSALKLYEGLHDD